MYKKILFALLLCGLMASAQEIKIKKDQIFLDGNPFLKYEKINLAEHSFRTENGDEVLYFQTKQDDLGETYLVFNFVQMKRKVKSDSVGRVTALGVKNMIEKMLTWLVKDKVLNTDGTINADALDIFTDKFNDHKD